MLDSSYSYVYLTSRNAAATAFLVSTVWPSLFCHGALVEMRILTQDIGHLESAKPIGARDKAAVHIGASARRVSFLLLLLSILTSQWICFHTMPVNINENSTEALTNPFQPM